MNATREWHDDPEFWQKVEPVLFFPQRLAAAPGEIDKIAALIQLQPASAILDMCCGIGRHSLELARRGHKVTGVDKTSAYLAKARQSALDEGLTVEFLQQDMKSFCRPDAFDAALSLFTSFGYYEDAADNQRVLVNIGASLKSGGKLIIDLFGKETLARVFQKRSWDQHGDHVLLEERTLLDGWQRVHTRWTILNGSQRYDCQMTLYLYSAAELQAMLQAAGFTQSETYGSLDGTPYDHEAKRLIVVATK